VDVLCVGCADSPAAQRTAGPQHGHTAATAGPPSLDGITSSIITPLRPDPDNADPFLDVVIPVYNEQTDLPRCVRQRHTYLSREMPYPFRITVADNASTDSTVDVAERLAAEFSDVQVRHLDRKGRGRALDLAWSTSPAPVLAYLDVDLSTDLAALFPLVAPLISGHLDIALADLQGVARLPLRDIASRPRPAVPAIPAYRVAHAA
jgi:hypothetical protein